MNIKLIDHPQTKVKFTKNLNPLEIVLNNRGISNIENFFKHDWDCVQDCNDLDNIDIAAKKIIYHLENSPIIAILVDCDADGMTSSAVLFNYLEKARFTGQVGSHYKWKENLPEFKFLFHEKKEHGLSDTTIMRQIRDTIKPNLLIIPDASGSAEQYKALNDLGIDIVVLDHHETTESGDGDKTIVVNNQQSKNYKNKSFSGVGIVYQLCRKFDELLPCNHSNDWLDLVAIGLVADVMSLVSDETRFLVNEGLKNINSLFLQQCLLDMDYSLKGELTPFNISFYIGPMINAVTRVGTMEEKEMLFKALLETEAEEATESGKRGAKGQMVPLVVEAIRQGINAKSRQERRKTKLAEHIDNLITEEGLLKNKVLIVSIDDFDDEQRQLSGLIANNLKDYYQRPCILLFDNNDGYYTGSVRVPDKIEVFDKFREQCDETKLCVYCAGHSGAFGIKISNSNIPNLQEYFEEKYKNVDVNPTYRCDFVVDADDFYLPQIIGVLAQYSKIWGQGLSEPLIGLKNVKVGPSNTHLLGVNSSPTIKIELPNGVECMKFKTSSEEYHSLIIPYDKKVEQCYNVDIVGTASINEWKGNVKMQLLIKEYKVLGAGYMF